jgi:hypothetical protein
MGSFWLRRSWNRLGFGAKLQGFKDMACRENVKKLGDVRACYQPGTLCLKERCNFCYRNMVLSSQSGKDALLLQIGRFFELGWQGEFLKAL